MRKVLDEISEEKEYDRSKMSGDFLSNVRLLFKAKIQISIRINELKILYFIIKEENEILRDRIWEDAYLRTE